MKLERSPNIVKRDSRRARPRCAEYENHETGGHGEADRGYVKFENGIVIHFDTMEILDWNTPVKDADLDPVSGGVWSSSLNPTVFRNSYTGSCKQRIMMVRFIRQVLNGWPFIGFRDIFTKD